MEKNVIIKEQFPLREYQYTDSEGQQHTVATRGFVLTDGLDSFYAEMKGDRARNIGTLPIDNFYSVSMELRSRSFKTTSGETMWTTDIYINNIKPIFTR